MVTIEKFEVRNRWTSLVQFTAEITCAPDATIGVKLGLAVGWACKSGADLSGADLSGADLRDFPIKIENIHQRVYEAASAPQALNMGTWHYCDTTHCRAGWVTTLAGDGGKALEWAMGTAAAAALIYQASDPSLEQVPNFYCGDAEALEDMKRMAEAEAARVPA